MIYDFLTRAALLFLLLLAVGCTNPTQADVAAKSHDDHDHATGVHGGFIVPVGHDHFHAEVIFHQDDPSRITLCMLGQDEAEVLEVPRQTLVAYLRAKNGSQSVAVTFDPDSQPDDAPDKTSRFAGRLPDALRDSEFVVVVPSIRIANARYRFSFESAARHELAMPAKVQDDAERNLYLTPAGKYTAADIAANGGQTASQKFRGFHSAHDANPKPGDVLCPITGTKANSSCSWIVNGQRYEFCCPPCIDEFVKLAKERPDELRPPTDFVK